MVRVRTASNADWLSVFETPLPVCWVGLAIERDGVAVGLGALFEDASGRWWVSFKGQSVPVSMQRGARELMGFARDQGLTLHAVADERIAGALKWMTRWGFTPTTETLGEHRIYQWTP